MSHVLQSATYPPTMNAKLLLHSMKRHTPCSLSAFSSLAAPKVHADTTYTYTGNPYSLAASPWTTSMFISGFFILPLPLPTNLAFGFITPSSFSFFDGVQTLTQSSASSSQFQVGTDATGQINQWSIFLQASSGGSIATTTNHDQASGTFGIPPRQGIAQSNSSGTWTSRTDAPSAVPESGSSVALLALSLTALAVAARRFKLASA